MAVFLVLRSSLGELGFEVMGWEGWESRTRRTGACAGFARFAGFVGRLGLGAVVWLELGLRLALDGGWDA